MLFRVVRRHERTCHDLDRINGPGRGGYSIDEAFADLSGIHDVDALGRKFRSQVLRCTGNPVGVGIAHTKTLAKLANHPAKRLQARTCGVVNICDPVTRDWVLRNTAVAEVWGVGRRMKMHLDGMGIKTAMDLAQADAWTLRKNFSVVVEKTARELAGTACLELDEPDSSKQEICCSRMFGKRLTELVPIKEAVATYVMHASENCAPRIRCAKRFASGMFNADEVEYANSVLIDLPYPSDDVRVLTKAAVNAVERIFRPGFKYRKAEVMFVNLCQPSECTGELFALTQSAEATNLMVVLDKINDRWGGRTLPSAGVPISPDWAMRREMMSQSYITRLNQLWATPCR